MNTELEEKIWQEAFGGKFKENTVEYKHKEDTLICSHCDSDNIMFNCAEGNTCGDCGTVINHFLQFSNYTFDELLVSKPVYKAFNTRLQKIQEWMSWSNSEKNEYRLKQYTAELCRMLNVSEKISEGVSDLVVKVMNCIKEKNGGPKRSRVKNGIIISCINYVSKQNQVQINYIDLAKKLDLDVKYISKADKLLMELNCLNENILNKTEDPLEHIKNVVIKYKLNLRISNIEEFVEKARVLVQICEDNDVLLDHTPLSIGCCCFYYVIKNSDIEVDIKMFAGMFELSNVTLLKTYNKLKLLKSKIDKLLF